MKDFWTERKTNNEDEDILDKNMQAGNKTKKNRTIQPMTIRQ
jgi:hypothetical protein